MKVIEDRCGYMRLEPVPPVTFSNYKNPLTKPEDDGWNNTITYPMVEMLLSKFTSYRRGLDVGCGDGALVNYLNGKKWAVDGIDPALSEEKRHLRRKHIEDLRDKFPYNFISMRNVLEHVTEPRSILETARDLLGENGVILVTVPNDFSDLQIITKLITGKEYWVNRDHINYFKSEVLEQLIYDMGFNPVYRFGDFPIELNILMGYDYISNPQLGPIVHSIRKKFEMTIGPKRLFSVYTRWSHADLCRNITIVGKKR